MAKYSKLSEQAKKELFECTLKDLSNVMQILAKDDPRQSIETILEHAISMQISRYRLVDIFPTTLDNFLGYATENALNSNLSWSVQTKDHVFSATNAILYPLLSEIKQLNRILQLEDLTSEFCDRIYIKVKSKMGFVLVTKAENAVMRSFQREEIECPVRLYEETSKKDPRISRLVPVRVYIKPGCSTKKVIERLAERVSE